MGAGILFLLGIDILLVFFAIWCLFGAISRINALERKVGILAARIDALKQAELERAAEKEKEVEWSPTRKVVVRNGNESYTMEILDTGFNIPLDFPNDGKEE